MANVKLGNKTYEGVISVKMDATDGSTVTFVEEPSGVMGVSAYAVSHTIPVQSVNARCFAITASVSAMTV